MEKKGAKRICIVGEFPPMVGGIAQQAQLLSDLLEKEGFQVQRLPIFMLPEQKTGRILQVRYLRSLVRFSSFLFRLMSNLRDSDIVHVLASSYLNYFLFTYPAVTLAKVMRKRVIMHYHGGGAEKFFRKSKVFGRIPVQMADQLLVPSRFLANVFCRMGFRAIVVPNIVNLDMFRYIERDSFSPTFLVARHLEPAYNIACVLKAFAIIRERYLDAKLNILGEGSEKNKLIELVKLLNLSDSVSFWGNIPNEQVPKFYKDSDVVLNTSKVDNMPISILEAFASGNPVVSTKAGGIPCLIQHKKTGLLVNIDDHLGLAREVLWLLEHPAAAKRLVSNARKVVQTFSWGEVKRIILDAYSVT